MSNRCSKCGKPFPFGQEWSNWCDNAGGDVACPRRHTIVSAEAENLIDSANSPASEIVHSRLEKAKKIIRSKWPFSVHFGLFLCAVLFAFLPTAWITWILLLGVGIPLVLHVIYRLSAASFGAGISILVASIFLIPLGLFLVVYVFSFLLAAVYPTVINLWAAWLSSRYIKPRFLQIFVFVAVTFLLGLSYRLLPIAEDFLRGTSNEKIDVVRVIELQSDEVLSVNAATETVTWRKDPSDFISVAGNEGCMCIYWVYPKQTTESIRSALQQAGVRYKMNGDSPKRIEMEEREDRGMVTLRLVAWDGNQKTASYEGLLRNGYGPEVELYSKGASIDSITHRLIYLASANLLNQLATKFLPQPPTSPIKNFIEKAFKSSADIATAPGVSKHVVAQMVNASFPQEHYSSSEFGSSFPPGAHHCDGKVAVTGYQITFLSGGEEFSAFLKDWLEFVECSDRAVYVLAPRVEYPKNGAPIRFFVLFKKYSLRGEILDSVEAELRDYHPQGFPRKPIRNFMEAANSYQFELNEFEDAKGRDGYTHLRSLVWKIPKAVQLVQ